ncbi:MAG: hypothetical protein AB9Q19_12710 [Candidatus Reddybacter sp.]
MSEEQNQPSNNDQPPEIGAAILGTLGAVICWTLSLTFLLTALSIFASNQRPAGFLAIGAALLANPLIMKEAMVEQIKQGKKPWTVGGYLGVSVALIVASMLFIDS